MKCTVMSEYEKNSFTDLLSVDVSSIQEAFNIGLQFIDKPNISLFIENTPCLNKEEKEISIFNKEEYVFVDGNFNLISRRMIVDRIICEDEIERYAEDYLPGAGTKFKLGEEVKLSKIRYPEAPDKLIVEAVPDPKTDKYWQNIYALKYILPNGEIEYYEYDLVNEKFIEKL